MVRIITDSASDLDSQTLERLGVEMLPILVHFGSETFTPGVDLENREFYDRLKAAKQLPTTSQIAPGIFEERFRHHTQNGDEVLAILISSKLSGTYQSACIARDSVDAEKVFVVDSLTATFGLGLMVHIAAQMRDGGAGARDIAAELARISEKITIFAFVDTLKYLKMGGRLSAASALVGGILHITPIITLGNGMVEAIGRTRGRDAAFKRVAELFAGVKRDGRYPVAVGHADAPEHIDSMLGALGAPHSRENALICEIGSTICVHIGLGAAGVAFVAE